MINMIHTYLINFLFLFFLFHIVLKFMHFFSHFYMQSVYITKVPRFLSEGNKLYSLKK